MGTPRKRCSVEVQERWLDEKWHTAKRVAGKHLKPAVYPNDKAGKAKAVAMAKYFAELDNPARVVLRCKTDKETVKVLRLFKNRIKTYY